MKIDKYVSMLLSVLLVPFLVAACIAQQTPATMPEPRPTSQPTSPPPTTEAPTVTPGLAFEPSPTPQPQTSTSTRTPMPALSPMPLPPTAAPAPVPSTPAVIPLPTAPSLTAAPTAERILFAPGATQTTVEGYLPTNGTQVYVMHVAAGQFIEMNATAGAMGQGLRFSIVGADGAVVKRMGDAHVRTVVPSTQDYYVELVSDVGAVDYRISVLIPVRIRFAPGATSAEVAGTLAAGDMRHYVLRALAGQRMIVDPYATRGQAGLVISGADGQVLLSGRVGRPGGVYDGILPTTQDYLISVRADGGTDADYTLEINIPPL